MSETAHEINCFSMRPSFKSLPQILPTISSKKPYHKQKKTDSLLSRISCQSLSLTQYLNNSYFLSSSHCNYCTALGMGEASVVMEDGRRRTAACIGGMLSVMNGKCRVLATTWEWKEDIDEQRAQEAKKRAEEMITKGGLSDHDYKIVEAKLQRALVRLSVKS